MSVKKSGRAVGLGMFSPPPRSKPDLPSRRLQSIEAEIGKTMRAMYDDLLEQPIPDRFVELLKQIDRAQENRSQ